MKKETIDMKENFVRADGVSYREAVEKCIRHYVMRGYDLKGETERFERYSVDFVFMCMTPLFGKKMKGFSSSADGENPLHGI